MRIALLPGTSEALFATTVMGRFENPAVEELFDDSHTPRRIILLAVLTGVRGATLLVEAWIQAQFPEGYHFQQHWIAATVFGICCLCITLGSIVGERLYPDVHKGWRIGNEVVWCVMSGRSLWFAILKCHKYEDPPVMGDTMNMCTAILFVPIFATWTVRVHMAV